MDCSLPGSSIHGIFQARVLEWGTCPQIGEELQSPSRASLWGIGLFLLTPYSSSNARPGESLRWQLTASFQIILAYRAGQLCFYFSASSIFCSAVLESTRQATLYLGDKKVRTPYLLAFPISIAPGMALTIETDSRQEISSFLWQSQHPCGVINPVLPAELMIWVAFPAWRRIISGFSVLLLAHSHHSSLAISINTSQHPSSEPWLHGTSALNLYILTHSPRGSICFL